MDTRYRIAGPHVVHQTIEGEVIIINLESGCYYSLTDTGAEVWALLEGGAAVADTVAALDGRYVADRGAIATAVDQLVANLRAEGLMVPADGDAAVLPVVATAPSRTPFIVPVLQKYSDMQDLLLIDPIHEVGESGWPGTKPEEDER